MFTPAAAGYTEGRQSLVGLRRYYTNVCFTLIEAAPAHTQDKYKIHVNHGSPHALHLKSMPNAKYGISNATSCFVQTFKNKEE